MSKLSDFLKSNGIAERRLLSASRQAERMRPEDRVVKLARRKNRGGKATDADKQVAEKKPRTGRALTPRTLTRALGGQALSGPAKTRITRAVNHVLGQKKKDAVDLRQLF